MPGARSSHSAGSVASTSITCHRPADRHDVDARRTARARASASQTRVASSARLALGVDELGAPAPLVAAPGSRPRAGRLRSAWPTRPSTSTTDHSPSSFDRGHELLHQHVALRQQLVEVRLRVRVADIGAACALARRSRRRASRPPRSSPARRRCRRATRPSRRGAPPSARSARRAPRGRAGTTCGCSSARARAGSTAPNRGSRARPSRGTRRGGRCSPTASAAR